jgi:putative ABC transport system permease protein
MWHRRHADDEFREEIEAHVALETDQLIADGLSPDHAAIRARRTVGNTTQIRERFYESQRFIWIEHVCQDVRFTLRSLRRSPGLAAIAILTLAIGIGANTAIFSVVNAVLLRPLPYLDADRLVLVEHPDLGGSPPWLISAWHARVHSLDGFAEFTGPQPVTVSIRDEPMQAQAAEVTPSFFPLLGVSPAIGSLLSEANAGPDLPGGALLSHSFWVRRFGGNPAVLGQTITLTGVAGSAPLVVVGVLAPEFRFPTAHTSGRTVLSAETQPDIIRLSQGNVWREVLGRLSPGSTPDAASAELQGIFRQEASGHFSPTFVEKASFVATPLQDRLVGDTRHRLLLLMGAVGCVLLIVCANVANLLLARLSTRQMEYAVRAALGARTGRLARLVQTESLLLAGMGGVAALMLAQWTGGVTRSLLVERVAHVGLIHIDRWVLAFSAIIVVVVGLLSGLASILALRSAGVAGIVSHGGGRSITSRIGLRRSLLIAEVAVTFVLVVIAALLSQTLWNLYHSKRGFEGGRIVTAGVMPNMSGTIPEIQRLTLTFFSDLTQQISRLPGVDSAAVASTVPLDRATLGMSGVSVFGQATSASGEGSVSVAVVSPGYFATIGTRLLAGRDFGREDSTGSERVAIVNEALRRQIAPGQALVGARINFDRYPLTVIGIAEDTPDTSPRRPARPFVYIPLDQSVGSSFGFGRLTILVRSQGPHPATLLPALRRAVWALGSDIVIDDVATMNERVAASVRTERHSALLFGLLAGIALLVAMTGVYGVVAYSVVQRTREIGLRIALGAKHWQVVGDVVRASAWPVAVGIALGLFGAAVATRAVASVLFETGPMNPAILAAAALVLTLTALTAAWIPARRAARIDPATALRAE